MSYKIHEADVEAHNRKTKKSKWVHVGRCNTMMEARTLARRKVGKGWTVPRNAHVETY